MNLEDLIDYKYKKDSWINDILTLVKTDQHQHKDIILTEYKIWNNKLYYHDKLIILNSEFLYFKILKFAHDTVMTEHSDQAKTYKIMQQFYYWLMMHDFI